MKIKEITTEELIGNEFPGLRFVIDNHNDIITLQVYYKNIWIDVPIVNKNDTFESITINELRDVFKGQLGQ